MSPDFGQVINARLPQRVGGPHLQQDVDEGTGFEVLPEEPITKDVEDGQQLFSRGVSAAPGLRNNRVDGPLLVTLLKEARTNESFEGKCR